MTSSAQLVASSMSAVLCGACMAHYPPPPKPEPIVPIVDAAPEAQPPEGSGRLVVDVVGEPAKVSRVVDTLEAPYGYSPHAGRGKWGAPALEQRRTELLCISPCILDLRRGAHTLVFASREDDTRTSSADVVVSAKPAAVRHALGTSKRFSTQYVGGLAMALTGGGFTTFGAFATTIGLLAKSPEDDPTGRTKGDPRVFLGVGLVMLGVGLALGTTGTFLARGDRPVEQPGSTVEWALP